MHKATRWVTGLAAMIGLLPSAAWSYELDQLAVASPQTFDAVADEALAAWSTRPQGLAIVPDGHRLQLAVAGHLSALDDTSAWSEAFGADIDESGLVSATARWQFGNRFVAGLGAAVVPDTEGKVYSAEVRWQPLSQTADRWLPSIELRGNIARLFGPKDLDIATGAIEALAGYRLGRLQPYVGAGWVAGRFDADGDGAPSASPSAARLLVGTTLSLPSVDATVEGDWQDGVGSLGLSLRFSWL